MRVIRRFGSILPVVLVLIGTGRARAAVVDSAQAGFLVRSEVVVHAAPDSVYRALTARIGAWWDPEHTFSGDSRNLSLDATAGGCFCERLPGGAACGTSPWYSPLRAGCCGSPERWGRCRGPGSQAA